MPTPRRLSEVKRNDVEGAIACARAKIEEAGTLSPDVAQSLLALQDDPAALIARLQALLATPPAVRSGA